MFPARSPAKGFDRLSPFYDTLARLFPGGWIERSQCVHLSRIRSARRVLIVGGGTGIFLRALLESGFEGTIVYVDVSKKMIRRARLKIADRHTSRVDFRHEDVRDLESHPAFDLICTHYVLDVFAATELDDVMDRLDRALEPGGLWLCTDFSPTQGRWFRRTLQGGLLRVLYTFFGVVCGIQPRSLPPIQAAFSRLGYRATSRSDLAWGVLWTAIYEKIGVASSGDQVTRHGRERPATAESHRHVKLVTE